MHGLLIDLIAITSAPNRRRGWHVLLMQTSR